MQIASKHEVQRKNIQFAQMCQPQIWKIGSNPIVFLSTFLCDCFPSASICVHLRTGMHTHNFILRLEDSLNTYGHHAYFRLQRDI